MQIKYARSSWQNYSFYSFDSESFQNATGYGSIGNGVLKSVPMQTGIQN